MRLLDLTGRWDLRGAGVADGIPAAVPGGVHAALMTGGIIPDPCAGDNADEFAWVGESEWTFERPFDVDDALLGHAVVDLECDGIDTFAEVFINGIHVMSADNMFRRWSADVKHALRPGGNTIKIVLEPPSRHGDKALARKARYSFGSDYSPECVTAGICRPIRLCAWDVARFREIGFTQRHSADAVELFIGGWLETFEGEDLQGLSISFEITDPDGLGICAGECAIPHGGEGAFSGKGAIGAPRLWWPNGMGGQPLYTVRTILHGADGVALDVNESRIGLRTLGSDVDEDGTVHVMCNGERVFLCGGVWIPPGVFPSQVSGEDYTYLVGSASDAGVNAFMLWPGGTFEGGLFWDLCDENGIIVLGAAEMCAAAVEGDAGAMPGVAGLLHHACVPDSLLVEPDEDNGLCVFRDELSFPCPATLEEAVPEGRRWLNGPDMDARVSGVHGASGIIGDLVAEWPVPSSLSDWLWLSQIAQGVRICDAILRSRLDPACSGVMWEPFASCWANADGSSIDGAGRWKALHFMVRGAFSEVAMYGVAAGDGTVEVRISDLGAEGRDVVLKWRACGMNGVVLDEGESALETGGRCGGAAISLNLTAVTEHYGEGAVVLWLELADALDGSGLARDFVLFAPPKSLELEDPRIGVDIDDTMIVDGEEVFCVTLCASGAAFWVWLDIPGEEAQFSDNFVCLEPDVPFDIYVSPVGKLSQFEFRRRLVVRSLYDIRGAMPP